MDASPLLTFHAINEAATTTDPTTRTTTAATTIPMIATDTCVEGPTPTAVMMLLEKEQDEDQRKSGVTTVNGQSYSLEELSIVQLLHSTILYYILHMVLH